MPSYGAAKDSRRRDLLGLAIMIIAIAIIDGYY